MNTAEALLFASKPENQGRQLIEARKTEAIYEVKDNFIYSPSGEAISAYWHTVFNKTEWETVKEPVDFITAVNSGKKFKYKTWNNFRNIQEVFKKLPGCFYLREIINDKGWILEDWRCIFQKLYTILPVLEIRYLLTYREYIWLN